MASQRLATLAQLHRCSPAQLIFRFAIDVGMIPLTGTTDAQHMQQDLGIFDIQLKLEEIELIECIAGQLNATIDLSPIG